MTMYKWALNAALALSVFLGSTQAVLAQGQADANPEGHSHRQERSTVVSHSYMAVTANARATEAALSMLAQGGSAADAAIAAQWVLNLVEPQSSGIGGGAFILSFSRDKGLQAYDGREVAAASSPQPYFEHQGEKLNFWQAVNSGRSVGVPGLVAALDMLHQDEGRLPWEELFRPAIEVAEKGFPVSPRLHAMLQQSAEPLAQKKAAANYFLDPQGDPWPVGHVLRNPQLAEVFRGLAEQGSRYFYQGELAQDIVNAVRADPVPGYLQRGDLQQYRVQKREPLCLSLKQIELCGMPPPSSGPLAVMQIMGILQHTPIARHAPDSWQAVHYFSEASRLAFADRDAWVADPDFVTVPDKALLSASYLRARAQLIQAEKSMGKASAGQPLGQAATLQAPALEQASTTHLVVADSEGNVISMTSSIESAFGSKLWVRGFLLNNQLSDFSFLNEVAAEAPHKNRLQAGKRPRSSMAPMIVFKNKQPYIALGAPGGSAIILYVAQALAAMVYWDMSPQQAIDMDHYGSRNGPTELEAGRAITRHADKLRTLGHQVVEQVFPSGTHAIAWMAQGLMAGVDPRREGQAGGR